MQSFSFEEYSCMLLFLGLVMRRFFSVGSRTVLGVWRIVGIISSGLVD